MPPLSPSTPAVGSPDPARDAPNSRWSAWQWFGLLTGLIGAALLAYSPALHGGLLWDDDAHITAPALQSRHGLWRIWSELGATQQYYPLLHSAFWIEHRLWGAAPLGYHLVNIVLHATSALLLGLILRQLRLPGALFAALVFALHPVQVESVAWISEQKNTLSTAFYLGAMLCYVRFDNLEKTSESSARSWRWYAAASALFLAALLTKTVTATLPAALLVVIWWRRGTLSWRREVRPVVPWFIIGAVAGLFTAWVEHSIVGAEGAAFHLSVAQRALLAGRALWFYLGKLVWPAHLAFNYPHWSLDPTHVGQWVPLAAALGVIGGLWRLRRRTRSPLAVALLFAGTLVPVLGFFNVYPFQYSYVADHFQYLASLGPIAALAASAAIATRRLQRIVRLAAGAAVVVLLGRLSWVQAHAYTDAETLYRSTLRENPDSWLAANNLGKLLMNQPGRLPEAIDLFEHALQIHPDYAEAENNLGLSLTQTHRPREALPHLEHAIALKPASYQAHNNLGIALAQNGQVDRALQEFARAAALAPHLPNVEENWGKALLLLGRTEEAKPHFARAAELRAPATK